MISKYIQTIKEVKSKVVVDGMEGIKTDKSKCSFDEAFKFARNLFSIPEFEFRCILFHQLSWFNFYKVWDNDISYTFIWRDKRV